MGKQPRMEDPTEHLAVSTSSQSGQSAVLVDRPHQVEHAVRRHLLTHPNLRFSSLVIRRIRDGVCLQGVLDADPNAPDVCTLAQSVAGVRQVLNHLVVRQSRRIPLKG